MIRTVAVACVLLLFGCSGAGTGSGTASGGAARERLVFLRGGAVWLADGDGPAVRLTTAPADAPDESPTLSPDGRLLAYGAAPAAGEPYRIHLMAIADRTVMAVTDGGALGDGEPCFSPDGASIYFMRGDPRDRKDLHRVEVAAVLAAPGATPPGSELLLAGDDDAPEQAGAPVVTRDGRAVVLAADRRAGRGTGLYRLELASRTLRRLTPEGDPRTVDRQPAVSPDGERIVFASNRAAAGAAAPTPAPRFALFALPPDGAAPTRLTADPGAADDPAFSADGERIYFVAARDGAAADAAELRAMPAAGGPSRPLRGEPGAAQRAPFATAVPTR